MPKSVSTIQNQIAGCERNITESLAQLSMMTGDKNFQFTFSLNAFVNGMTPPVFFHLTALKGGYKCTFSHEEYLML